MPGIPFIDPDQPLIDLHRHLDGAIRLQTVVELAEEKGIELPAYDVAGLSPHVVVASISARPTCTSWWTARPTA